MARQRCCPSCQRWCWRCARPWRMMTLVGDAWLCVCGHPVQCTALVPSLLPACATCLHHLPGEAWHISTLQFCPSPAGVATHAIGCVHALGVNLPARHWMPLAAEAVAAEQHTVAQRTAALVVLSGLLYGAAKSGSAEDSNCLQLAATTLCSAHLGAAAAAADGAALRQQLLAACSNLLQWAGPASAGIGAQLFQLLLQLWAVEADSGAEASAAAAAEKSGAPDSASLTAAGVLAQLAAALGSASPADLCDQYGPAMLQSCLQVSGLAERSVPGGRAHALSQAPHVLGLQGRHLTCCPAACSPP